MVGRRNRRGRAIGVMLMGVKKGIKIIEHKKKYVEKEGIMMKVIILKGRKDGE